MGSARKFLSIIAPQHSQKLKKVHKVHFSNFYVGILQCKKGRCYVFRYERLCSSTRDP